MKNLKLPFAAAIVVLVILALFFSGAFPLNSKAPVDLGKLKDGQAVYQSNK